MTDPMDALNHLQTALNQKTVKVCPCDVDPTLRMMVDYPQGTPRFTYAQIEADTVQAIAILIMVEPFEGMACFQVGYAVLPTMRGRGIAGKILQQAVNELTHGLNRNGVKQFYVEAIVANDNVASNKLASRLISDTPKPCIDGESDEPAHQYMRKVNQGA